MSSKARLLLLRYATITGNIIFILWILYNGISEGFVGTLLEKLSYIGLMGLLGVNSAFLLKDKIQ